MSTGLFCFLQVEVPFALGPQDGRWLIRREREGKVERVVVLRTVGAGRADARSRRRRAAPAKPQEGEARERQGEPVQITRATIIDPHTVAGEDEARAWLAKLEPERTAEEALGWINEMLRSHRIAAADPYVHELGVEQALAVRAGFGAGEHVAEGRWLRALTLPVPPSRRRVRKRDEARQAHARARLAALLGSRSQALLCEELALRARLDLDEGRPRLAAIELERAYATALVELREHSPDVLMRAAELRRTKAHVTQLALVALALEQPFDGREAELDAALGLLEAALRARGIEPPPSSRSSD